MRAHNKNQNVLKVLRLDIYIKKVKNWCTAGADSHQYCGRFFVQGLRVQQRRAFEGITLQLPLRPIPDFTPKWFLFCYNVLHSIDGRRITDTVAEHWRVTSGRAWGVCAYGPSLLMFRTPLCQYSRMYPNASPSIQQSVYLSYRGTVCFFSHSVLL